MENRNGDVRIRGCGRRSTRYAEQTREDVLKRWESDDPGIRFRQEEGPTCRFELLKLVLAGELAVICSRILLSATEYPLRYVIPWLMGAVRPPPLPWW